MKNNKQKNDLIITCSGLTYACIPCNFETDNKKLFKKHLKGHKKNRGGKRK